MATLAEVTAALERRYDPSLAEPWDAVGLVCGDPDDRVRSVLFAVDPVAAVVDEAIERGVDLLVTHHPLFLRPVHGVAATTFKGRTVHRLLRHGIALYTAHTNADAAELGVSDALAAVLGLHATRPLVPATDATDEPRGLGRVGELTRPEPLAAFVERVAAALPVTTQGVRAAGDPERPIRTVAVCGGAGDGFFDAVRAAGVDAYVTADLRHHPASEALEAGGPALVDAAHWATEWPWLAGAAALLVADIDGDRGLAMLADSGEPVGPRRSVSARSDHHVAGITVDAYVSTRVTDAWTLHRAGGDG